MLEEIEEEEEEEDQDAAGEAELDPPITEADKIASYGDVVKDFSKVGLSVLKEHLFGDIQGSIRFTKAMDDFANRKGTRILKYLMLLFSLQYT